MIFGVAEQISYLSSRVTLLPGDLIMTGTPAGTGIERGRFLLPGQTMRMSIERLGEMTVRVDPGPR
jgi:2-keto-4-pentenoate hydratase/2-oxohepta-3-ene-1,7-dioic acid hydratase in catechol pathway